MEEINVATWEEFLEGLNYVRNTRTSSTEYVQGAPLLFRGQRNSDWLLSATLERARERMIFKDYYRIIDKLRPQIESLVGGDWPILSYPEIERLVRTFEGFNDILWAGDYPAYAYMAYLRHHGFPSPLLDWSRSPYVAAHFAFANAHQDRNGMVSIFVLCERNFSVSGNRRSMVRVFGPYVKTHRRHILQQSQYTVCLSFDDEWRFEKYDSVFDVGLGQQAFCWKFTIPVTEQRKVLAMLDEHNLNAFSLLGTEESLMETLASREF